MHRDHDTYYACFDELASWLISIDDKIDKLTEVMMDKQIKKIKQGTEKLVKQEGALLKEDQKRDKVCDAGEKLMKDKKKK